MHFSRFQQCIDAKSTSRTPIKPLQSLHGTSYRTAACIEALLSDHTAICLLLHAVILCDSCVTDFMAAYNAKLETQAEKQSRINAFVCKPVLLRLASDISSLSLSAVKPDARVHDRSDNWSTPLQHDKSFASSCNRLCTEMHCPLGTSLMVAGFNKT